MSLVAAAALGLALGAITGMPLGVINVAIADAATSGRPRFARGLGLGGALADTIHSSIAFLGVGGAVTARPALVRILAVAAAVAIVAYAVSAWRHRERVKAAMPASDVSSRGVATGFGLTIVNPGALVGWIAIASAVWPHAEPLEAIVIALGIGVGSAAWFTFLAKLLARVRPDHPALRYVPRFALVALVLVAVAGAVHAFV